MSPSSVLLRVVLSLVLILNGSGYAVAATGMELAHLSRAMDGTAAAGAHAHDGAAMASHSGDRMPCHEAPAVASAPHAEHSPPVAHDAHGSGHGDTQAQGPDCCTTTHCGCACLQHLTATVPVFPMGPALVVHLASHRTMASAHAAPLLPHLIRPPIG